MKLLLFFCTGSITLIRYYLSLHTTKYADKTHVCRWSSSISAVKMWWVDLLSLWKPHSASKIQTTNKKMEKRAKAAGAVSSATNLQQVGININMQMLRNFSFYGSSAQLFLKLMAFTIGFQPPGNPGNKGGGCWLCSESSKTWVIESTPALTFSHSKLAT